MAPTCVHCGSQIGRWKWCPALVGHACETQEALDRRRDEERRRRSSHHYIDPTARALLIAEYVRNGHLDRASDMIRETAEHAHENARGGYGPLGQ